jgi:hypothetical protein
MENYNSKNAIEFLKEIDTFSNVQLKKRDDLHKIFEEIFKENKYQILEEISFTSKYVQGLVRVLKSGAGNADVKNLEHVKIDLSSNINKVIEKIREVISTADEETHKYFEKNYFEMSQHGFLNLNELMTDFEWVKKYLNEQKRKNMN